MRSSVCLSATALVFIVLVSCTDEQPKKIVIPPQPKPISMSVSVVPPEIRFLESATVVLSLTNDSPDEVPLDFECQDPFGYILKAVSGSFTSRNLPACFGPPHTIVLKVGETRTFAMTISSNLAPMSYEVRAGMMEYAEEYPWVSTRFLVRPLTP